MAEEMAKSEAEAFTTSGDLESSASKDEDVHVVFYSGKGTAEEKAIIRRQDLRLLPLCGCMYLLAFLDRSNIGNAKVLNADTNDDVCMISSSSNPRLTVFPSCCMIRR
jgi:hypothetical protein